MYKGKYRRKSRKRFATSITVLTCLILLVFASIGATLAFMKANTSSLLNTFESAEISTEIVETFNGNSKTDVYVKNTGSTGAWIRAAIVVTWQDGQGNVYGKSPEEGKDYSITLSSGWLRGANGFLYYESPVTAGNQAKLIETCTFLDNAPDGYSLNVEILGSGIQCRPISVFNDYWGTKGISMNSDGTKLEKVN